MAKHVHSMEPKTHLEFFLESQPLRKVMGILEQGLEQNTEEMPRGSTKMTRILATAGMSIQGNKLRPDIAVPYCVLQCAPTHAIWTIEQSTAEALYRTELPFYRFPSFPKIPFRGLYLRLPKGLFQIENNETGMHAVEGFYLVEDKMWNPDTNKWDDAILVLGTGESKGDFVDPFFGLSRDDAIVFFHLSDSKSFEYAKKASIRGIPELLHVAVNLLWALHTRHLHRIDIIPALPKSPGKLKKRSRQGLTMLPYSVIQLSQPKRASSRSKVSGVRRKRSPDRPVVVSGHWRSYWVLYPGEETIIEVKPRMKNIDGELRQEGYLHRVSRWIHPYIIQPEKGEIQSPRAVVRK